MCIGNSTSIKILSGIATTNKIYKIFASYGGVGAY
jgi:hypothetical protein